MFDPTVGTFGFAFAVLLERRFCRLSTQGANPPGALVSARRIEAGHLHSVGSYT